VQRSFFNSRSFAAAGERENLDEFVPLRGIERVMPTIFAAITVFRKQENPKVPGAAW